MLDALNYYFESFLYWLGFRKVYYYPSRRGLPMADFHAWKYRPDLPPITYSELTYKEKRNY